MEANKAEAERCVDIAKQKLAGGEREKALKFLEKAQRLHPSPTIKKLVSQVLSNGSTPTGATRNGPQQQQANGHAPSDRPRTKSPKQQQQKSGGGDPSRKASEDYTPNFSQYESTARSRFHTSKSSPTFQRKSQDSQQKSTADASTSSTSSNDDPPTAEQKRTTSPGRPTGRPPTASAAAAGSHNRSRSSSMHRVKSEPTLGVDYTKDELAGVKRIQRSKDYYEILNLKKDFNDGELKKNYRKLALQFHPDKCRAPGATEAFKALGNAYACLSDKEKRERYDMYGSESGPQPPSRSHHRNHYNGGFERWSSLHPSGAFWEEFFRQHREQFEAQNRRRREQFQRENRERREKSRASARNAGTDQQKSANADGEGFRSRFTKERFESGRRDSSEQPRQQRNFGAGGGSKTTHDFTTRHSTKSQSSSSSHKSRTSQEGQQRRGSAGSGRSPPEYQRPPPEEEETQEQEQPRPKAEGVFSEFTPDEIFNMFFGGGYPTGTMYRRGNRTYFYQHSADHNTNETPASSFGAALQLLPILLLLFLSLASQLLIGEPAFSLQRNNKYTQLRHTQELQVPYYVKPDFLKHYANNIARIESQVEDDHIQSLRMGCYRERNQKETMAWRARTYGDAALLQKAQSLPTPNCDRLNDIYR